VKPVRGSRSYGRARFLAGQDDVLWIPAVITRPYPIFYMPSGNSLALAGATPLEPGVNALLAACAAAGAVVVVCDWDMGSPNYGASWGAPPITARMEEVRTELPGVLAALGADVSRLDNSKIVLSGGSQGACDCSKYARDFPERTQAIGTWAAAIDLDGFYANAPRWGGGNGGVSTPVIGACWNVVPPAPLPAEADPYNNAGDVECPWLLAYSDGDTVCTPAAHLAMAAALPNGTAVKVSDTAPHTDEAALASVAALGSFLIRQAAG
jgi:pimeloyl-ACP methyl ester carboxylesterase